MLTSAASADAGLPLLMMRPAYVQNASLHASDKEQMRLATPSGHAFEDAKQHVIRP